MLLDYDELDDWVTLPVITDADVDYHDEDADLENTGTGVSYVHHATYQNDSNSSHKWSTSYMLKIVT